MTTAITQHRHEEKPTVSDTQSPKAPTFVDLLADLEDGRLARDLTDKIRELAKRLHTMAETHGGKPKGKLVITLDMRLDAGIYDIVGAVAVKHPEPPRARSLVYPTKDGGLSVENPRQLALPFGSARDATPTREDLRVI